MLPGKSNAAGKLIQQKDAVLFSPFDGITRPNKTVNLLSKCGENRIQTGRVIIEGSNAELKRKAPVIDF